MGSILSEGSPKTEVKKDKAARPDDAKAEAEDWDRWTMENFSTINAPLVCHGKYDEMTHGKLFNALRKLLVRRYQLNVTQSFLKFMKSKHYPRMHRSTQVGMQKFHVSK